MQGINPVQNAQLLQGSKDPALSALLKSPEGIEGRVLQSLPDGNLSIATRMGVLQLRSDAALAKGTLVQLLAGSKGELLLKILDQEQPAAPKLPINLQAASALQSPTNAQRPASAAVSLLGGLIGALQGGLDDGAVSPAPQAVSAPQTALNNRILAAQSIQNSLAPLFADLDQALQSSRAGLPPDVAEAMDAVLKFRLTPDKGLDGQAIQNAMKNSGIFLEAKLAQTPSAAPALAPDMKSTLLRLQTALAGQFANVATMALETTSKRPALPRRDQALQAQSPALSTLHEGMPLEQLGAQLLRETREAIERVHVLQLANLDPTQNINLGAAQSALPHSLVFELPVAVGQHTTVAQFAIQEEKRDNTEQASEEDRGPAWRMRFSLETPDMGRLHGSVRLQDHRVDVNLWAEERQSFAVLHQQLPHLRERLRAAQLDIGEMHCINGSPNDMSIQQSAYTHIDRST